MLAEHPHHLQHLQYVRHAFDTAIECRLVDMLQGSNARLLTPPPVGTAIPAPGSMAQRLLEATSSRQNHVASCPPDIPEQHPQHASAPAAVAAAASSGAANMSSSLLI